MSGEHANQGRMQTQTNIYQHIQGQAMTKASA